MSDLSVAPAAMTTLARVARCLSVASGVDDVSLTMALGQSYIAWLAVRSADAPPRLLRNANRWCDSWVASDTPAADRLTPEGLSRSLAWLQANGVTRKNVRGHLTSLNWVLNAAGIMTPTLRKALRQFNHEFSAQRARRPWSAQSVTLHAEVCRLVKEGNPIIPRDVRNTVIVLIVFEGMAQLGEVLGPGAQMEGSRRSVRLSDLRFDAHGGSTLRLQPIVGRSTPRTIQLSVDATRWMRHWLSLRGDGPGPLFAYGKARRRDRRVAVQRDIPSLWDGPARLKARRKQGLGVSGVSASSLRLGRAIGLLDAGWSVSRVASWGGWVSVGALVQALDFGLSVSYGDQRPPEPRVLRWPLPRATGAATSGPEQLSLRLWDAAA